MKNILVLAICCIALLGCKKDDKELPDPEGTITINLDEGRIRLPSNGYSWQAFSWQTPNNIETEHPAVIISLGKVKGLAAITKVPNNPSWSETAACENGNGYIIKLNETFCRLYVVDRLVSTDKGIMGAKVKYQVFTPEQ